MDIMGTLKSKFYGIPVWAIALVFVGALAWYMRKHKKAPAAPGGTTANASTGTTSQLSDMFPTAGNMPFQGGDVFVNTTGTGANGGTKTANVAAGQTIDQVIQGIRQSSNPNFSWSDFLSLNPGITSSSSVEFIPASPARTAVGLGPDYKFVKDTPVVVSNAGLQSVPVPSNYPMVKG